MIVEPINKQKLVPSAHLLLSSLRSVGYTVETAIADIIDNSITAKATHIGVFFDWENQQILIYDNGLGMPKDDLIQSMAIGSSDPDKIRDSYDLGRFGMGMKTAAFSLGKSLTVVTKYNGNISNACWDLDYISQTDEWNLIIYDNENKDINRLSEYISSFSCGTVICIKYIDKVIGTDVTDKEKRRFYKMVDNVKSHLSLVFHRFIEEDGISIKVNGNTDLPAWNPFVTNNPAVQILSPYNAGNNGKEVNIQPYVLPHKTKFKFEEDFKKAGGYKGWLQHQGFYVYRNRRLIVFGTWFGLFKKETSFNLARLRLDITSDSDFDWQIDIKKSKAIPPTYAEDIIKSAAEYATRQSVKVYNSRGTYSKKHGVSAPQLSCVWEQRKDSRGNYTFVLNKKHTLLNKLKISLTTEQKDLFDSYFQLVEKCSPMALSGITATMGSSKSDIEYSQNELNDLRYSAKVLIETLKANEYDKEEILDLLKQMTDYVVISDELDSLYEE